MKKTGFWKYAEECRSDLSRMPLFWIGIAIIISGIILGVLNSAGFLTELFILMAGMFILFGTFQRVLGRIEERHFRKKR